MANNQDLTIYKRVLQPNLRCYQILIDNVSFTINDSKVAKSAMLDQCRQYFSSCKTHRIIINKFAKKYQSTQAALWYTKDCFIHRIVNRVLRTGNIEHCSLLRFYIADLSEQLYRLKCQQQKNIVQTEAITILYRGLRQSEVDLQTLRNHIGHVILIKGFMSSSRNKQIAFFYAGASHPQSSQSQSLLIELYVDMKATDIIAADISHLSNFPEEREVLFDIGSQFRVESLIYDLSNIIWHCHLVAISNKSQSVQLPQHISSNESYINLNTYNEDEAKLDRIMRRERRQRFTLIHQDQKCDSLWCKLPSVSWIANNSSDRARILQQKALIHWQRNANLDKFRLDCKHAWELLKKMNSTIIEHNDTACFLNNFGYTCQQSGDTEYAIDLLKKSFEIRARCGASEHFLAQSLRNLGLAYTDLGDYENAVASLSHALIIGKQARSTTQWSTSMTLRNFAYFYHIRGDYIQAVEYLSKALETFQQCANLCVEYSP